MMISSNPPPIKTGPDLACLLKSHQVHWGFNNVMRCCKVAYVNTFLPELKKQRLRAKGLIVFQTPLQRSSMGRILGRGNKVGVCGIA